MEKKTIFISHITQERELAATLKQFLQKRFLNTISVFASSHDDSLPLGDEWMSSIKNSILKTELIIVLCSPISITRPWITFEAGAGWAKGIPVIPLCHSGLTPGKLPVPLNTFQGGILNSKVDINKVFKRISKILDIDVPESDNENFYEEIMAFENQIESTNLVSDTTFVRSLLSLNLQLLDYCLVKSFYNDEAHKKIIDEGTQIYYIKYEFKNMLYTHDISNLMYSLTTQVYQIFYDTLLKVREDIKFILQYNEIEIAPELQKLLHDYLLFLNRLTWYKPLSIIANKSAITEVMKDVISKSDENKQEKSNIINAYWDYFNSLMYIKDWLKSYRSELLKILKE